MDQRGVSLLEALVALVVGALLLALALRTLDGVRTGSASLTRRSDHLQAVRVARSVVRREGAGWVPPSDLPDAADTLVVRAFRGTALPCLLEGERSIVVLGGLRWPEPRKDSVLLLGVDGVWSLHRLAETEPAGCPAPRGPDGPAQRWTLEPPPTSRWVVARYFERGSYHLSAAALRYRSGQGGRQPLTPELLSDRSRFRWDPPGLRAELIFERGPAWIVPLGSPGAS